MRKLGLSALLLGSLVAGCTPPPLAKPPMKAPEVLVTKAKLETVQDYEEFTGRTEAKSNIEIKARVTGYLHKVLFKDGDLVKEGDPLFEIDASPYEVEKKRAEATMGQATSKLARLERDYKRALASKDAISPGDFDKTQGEYKEAVASLAVARANLDKALLDLDYTKIAVPSLNGLPGSEAGPRVGRVSRRLKDPGNLIKADDTPLTTIVTLNPMYVYFDIDERTVLGLRGLIAKKKIKSLREMTFRFELADDEGKFPHQGKINFEDNRLDTSTGTLQLRGEFDNTKGFSPGLFVRLRLYLGVDRKAVLVPERALGTDQGQKFLYVIKTTTDKEGKTVHQAEYRTAPDIELGPLRDGWRVIERGVEPGEEIIWSGLQRVRKDASVTPKNKDPL